MERSEEKCNPDLSFYHFSREYFLICIISRRQFLKTLRYVREAFGLLVLACGEGLIVIESLLDSFTLFFPFKILLMHLFK